MAHRASRPAVLALLAAALCAFSACLTDPGDTVFAIRRYPLEEGWAWTYRRTLRVELVDGSAPPFLARDEVTVRTTGPTTIEGESVFGLVSAPPDRVGPEVRQFFLQDGASLSHLLTAGIGADLSAFPKPGAAPLPAPFGIWAAAPGVQESAPRRVVFAFPLQVGSAWIAETGPPVVLRRVVGEERLEVAGAWRRTLRVDTGIVGDDEAAFADWVGEEGLLRRVAVFTVPESLFPGHPADERISELIELIDLQRPAR